MSTQHPLLKQDRERAGDLKFKISLLRDQLSEQEWELRSLYRQNGLSRRDIESTINHL